MTVKAAIPQDSRSPHRQQRWLLAKNVGSVDIPPHAVVEITDATHDGDGVTILEVQRPTANSFPNVAANGLLRIPVGGYGYVTDDFPAYVKYTGSPVEGEVYGAVSGSFEAQQGYTGFWILGDAHDGIVRVLKTNRRVEIVKKTSDVRDVTSGFYPGKLLSFDPETKALSVVDDIWLEDMNEV